MTDLRDLRLARIVKSILDLLFGLLVFAIIALVIWILISPLLLNRGTVQGTASVPVRIGSWEESYLDLTFARQPEDEIGSAFVRQAQGTLVLETGSIYLVLLSNATKLVIAIGLAFALHLLRLIVRTTLDGNPFAAENIQRLRRLGYAVIAVGVIGQVIEYVAANEILHRLPAMSTNLSPGKTFNPEIILTSLLIFLLAHIWSYGLELKRDQELTI
jgi:hypothetical protein